MFPGALWKFVAVFISLEILFTIFIISTIFLIGRNSTLKITSKIQILCFAAENQHPSWKYSTTCIIASRREIYAQQAKSIFRMSKVAISVPFFMQNKFYDEMKNRHYLERAENILEITYWRWINHQGS